MSPVVYRTIGWFFTPEGGEVFSMSEKRLIHDSSLDIRLGKCEKDNLNNLWISNGYWSCTLY